MKQRISDLSHFMRQMWRQTSTTGAVMPSGRLLAKAITRPLAELDSPRRILEIGPGTGAFTDQIVRELRPEDRLDLVEINSEFADYIRRRFENLDSYRAVTDQCEVHCVSLDEFEPENGFGSYDAVVSGLPLNNFSPDLVSELVEASLKQVRPGGTFSMFEYMYVRPVRMRFGPRETRDRMQAIEEIMQSQFEQYRFRQDWVFLNMLPAWVQHLRVTGEPVTTNGELAAANS